MKNLPCKEIAKKLYMTKPTCKGSSFFLYISLYSFHFSFKTMETLSFQEGHISQIPVLKMLMKLEKLLA
jgi:hypothetical protein